MTLVHINTISPPTAHAAIFVLMIHAYESVQHSVPFDTSLVAALCTTIRNKMARKTKRLDFELAAAVDLPSLVALFSVPYNPLPPAHTKFSLASSAPALSASPSPPPLSPVASPLVPASLSLEPLPPLPSPIPLNTKTFRYVPPEYDSLVQYFFDPNTMLVYQVPAWFAEPYLECAKRLLEDAGPVLVARLASRLVDRIGLGQIDERTTQLCVDGEKTLTYF